MAGRQARPAAKKPMPASASSAPAAVPATSAPADALLLTVDEAAARLRRSRRTLYPLLMRGEIASIKDGQRRFIPAWALVAYIRKLCEQQGVTDEYGLMAG